MSPTCLDLHPKLVQSSVLLFLLAFVRIGEPRVSTQVLKMDKWLDLCKEIGLSGQDLHDFVRERERTQQEKIEYKHYNLGNKREKCR